MNIPLESHWPLCCWLPGFSSHLHPLFRLLSIPFSASPLNINLCISSLLDVSILSLHVFHWCITQYHGLHVPWLLPTPTNPAEVCLFKAFSWKSPCSYTFSFSRISFSRNSSSIQWPNMDICALCLTDPFSTWSISNHPLMSVLLSKYFLSPSVCPLLLLLILDKGDSPPSLFLYLPPFLPSFSSFYLQW